MLGADVEHAFQYISEENERVWLPAFRDTVRLRFHPLAEVRRNHRPYDLLRAVKYTAGFGLGRLRGRRALLDDLYAVFAAPWLHRRVGCRVRDRLGPLGPELEAAVAAGGDGHGDGVGQASLLWRVIYGTVAAYRREIDGLEVVRHEDLSADPVPAFRALYGRLGLPFGSEAEQAIVTATTAGSDDRSHRWSISAHGVSKTAARTAGPTCRCGERLTEQEVAPIREPTAGVAEGYG